MYYVYILVNSVNDNVYIGRTQNVVARLREHNSGRNLSTKPYRPWRIAYLEGYFSREEAVDREHKLKQFGKVYSQLKRRIGKSILNAQKVRG